MLIQSIILIAPLVAAGLIAGGVAVAGMIGGAITDRRNRKANQKQIANDRLYNQGVYDQQRKDALADQEALNKYNDPIQQMNRYRQAGINPNQIFNNGAQSTGAVIRGVEQPTQTNEHNKYSDRFTSNAAQSIEQFQQLRLQDEQIKNIQADTANTQAVTINTQKESTIKDATLASILQNTARTKFQLTQSERIADLVYKKAALENQASEANILYTSTGIGRAEAANKREEQYQPLRMQIGRSQIAKNKTEIANIQQQTKNALKQELTTDLSNVKTQAETIHLQKQTQILESDRIMKQIQAELAAKGVYPGDPYYYRELKLKIIEYAKNSASEPYNVTK